MPAFNGTANDAEYDVERSARLHDLTKRLNKKDEPEIEIDEPKIDKPLSEAWG